MARISQKIIFWNVDNRRKRQDRKYKAIELFNLLSLHEIEGDSPLLQNSLRVAGITLSLCRLTNNPLRKQASSSLLDSLLGNFQWTPPKKKIKQVVLHTVFHHSTIQKYLLKFMVYQKHGATIYVHRHRGLILLLKYYLHGSCYFCLMKVYNNVFRTW